MKVYIDVTAQFDESGGLGAGCAPACEYEVGRLRSEIQVQNMRTGAGFVSRGRQEMVCSDVK